MILFFILFIVISLPVAWFISELMSNSRFLRCTLGVLAILCCFGVAWLTAQLVRFNYNSYYGFATQELVDATVEKLEAGESETVLQELKQMQKQYQPTYENRAHFGEIATETAKKIRTGSATDTEK